MPAPGLRNKGQSLTETVETLRHTDNMRDARDRHVANRERAAARWEEAATALERRTDLVPDPAPAKPRQPGSVRRWWLGYCLRCDAEMWTTSPRPRVPVCCGPTRPTRRKRHHHSGDDR